MGKTRRYTSWKSSPQKDHFVKEIIQLLGDDRTHVKRRMAQLNTLNNMIANERDYLKRYLFRQDLCSLGMLRALNYCRVSCRETSAIHPLKTEIQRFEAAEQIDHLPPYEGRSPINIFAHAYTIAKARDSENILMEFLDSFDHVTFEKDWKISIIPRGNLSDTGLTLTKNARRGPFRVRSKQKELNLSVGTGEKQEKLQLTPAPLAKSIPPPLPPPKSIPAPPPSLFSGFLAATVTKSSELWPKSKKTTTFCWDRAERVEPNSILNETTIWNDSSSLCPDFDNEEREELAALFEVKELRRKSFTSAKVVPISARKQKFSLQEPVPAKVDPKVSLLSNQRCLTICVALKPFGSTSKGGDEVLKNFYDACQGKKQVDALCDCLQNLLRSWPTSDELAKYAQIERCSVEKDPVNLFCWQLSRDKTIRLRCQLILVKERLVIELREHKNAIDRLYDETKKFVEDEIIVEMLWKCKMYGNFINQGSSQAEVAGFSLSSLEKTLCAPNQTLGIVNTIGKHSKRQYQEIEAVVERLKSVKDVNLGDMKKLVKECATELQTRKVELRDNGSDDALQKEFEPVLKEADGFLNDVENRLKLCQTQESEIKRYFWATKMSMTEIFTTVMKGLSMWAIAAKKCQQQSKQLFRKG